MEKGGQRANWRRETECCYKRVAARVVNLTVGQIFITARERIILDLIKINIKNIFKSLDVFFSLDTLTIHTSVKLPIYRIVQTKMS